MSIRQTKTHPLRRERELRGWSRSYVAERLEVDVMTVGRWEREERLPQPYHRQKLCELFEMNAQELGLLPQRSEESNNPEGVSGLLLQGSDSVHTDSSLLHASAPSLHLSDSPSQESPENGRKRSFFSPFHRRRRRFLITMAGLGGAILATCVWSATQRVSPAPNVKGKLLCQLFDPNSNNWINHVAYSPDGSLLVAGCGSNVSTVWNIKERAVVYYYSTLNQWVNDVSWSKSNMLATANGAFSAGSIQVWQIPQKEPIFTHHRDSSMRTVSWSPKGDYLAFAGHGTTVEVWNPFTSRLMSSYTYTGLTLMGINRVKWSFDARYIACGDDDGTVHVWEATTGKPVTIYRGHQGRVMDLAWCPGKYLIASASTDQTAQVWDALSGQAIVTYTGHKGEVHGIDWSPNRKSLASGSYDTTVQVWEALTGQHIYTYTGRNSHVLTVCWSANGAFLVSGSQGQGIGVWSEPLLSNTGGSQLRVNEA